MNHVIDCAIVRFAVEIHRRKYIAMRLCNRLYGEIQKLYRFAYVVKYVV